MRAPCMCLPRCAVRACGLLSSPCACRNVSRFPPQRPSCPRVSLSTASQGNGNRGRGKHYSRDSSPGCGGSPRSRMLHEPLRPPTAADVAGPTRASRGRWVALCAAASYELWPLAGCSQPVKHVQGCCCPLSPSFRHCVVCDFSNIVRTAWCRQKAMFTITCDVQIQVTGSTRARDRDDAGERTNGRDKKSRNRGSGLDLHQRCTCSKRQSDVHRLLTFAGHHCPQFTFFDVLLGDFVWGPRRLTLS